MFLRRERTPSKRSNDEVEEENENPPSKGVSKIMRSGSSEKANP